MAGFDNAHSRLVAWLKILLPLAALAILSTLFLFSRTIDPSRAIPFARVDVKELAQEPRITAPNYAGVTADGTAVQVSADTATPGKGGTGATAAGLTARLETPDGATTDITAATGSVNPANGRMLLEGGVRIVNSSGYTINADGLSAALNRTELHSDGPVAATGPLGSLTAGGMSLSRDAAEGDAPSPYVLVFKDGVKLVYQPRDKGK